MQQILLPFQTPDEGIVQYKGARVGSYQLKLGEQFYPVVIKYKETVEY